MGRLTASHAPTLEKGFRPLVAQGLDHAALYRIALRTARHREINLRDCPSSFGRSLLVTPALQVVHQLLTSFLLRQAGLEAEQADSGPLGPKCQADRAGKGWAEIMPHAVAARVLAPAAVTVPASPGA